MAVATNAQLIAGLYAAVFNRAPDPAGLTFWENAFTGSATIYNLAEGFAAHPVFASTYGGMNNAQFVASIYQKVLGAGGDADGLAYWTAKADSGISRADIVAEFVNDSLTVDLALFTNLTPAELAVAQNRQDALTNKVDVGLTFAAQFGADANLNPATDTSTQAGLESDPAYLAAQAAIANVTASPASVTTAKANITAALATANPTGTLIGITPPVVVDPGTPTTPIVFTALETSGVVAFGGSALGEITVSVTGNNVTFTRAGIDAPSVALSSITGINSAVALNIKYAGYQALVSKLTTANTVIVNDNSLTASDIALLGADPLVDDIGAAIQVLTATQFAAAGAKLRSVDNITISDSPNNVIAKMSDILDEVRVIDRIDVDEDTLTLTYEQFSAITAAKLQVADEIIVTSSEALSDPQLTALLEEPKVDAVDLVITAAQFSAHAADFASADTITVKDTGTALTGQLASLVTNVAKVDAINSSSEALTLTADQLSVLNTKLSDTHDVLTITSLNGETVAGTGHKDIFKFVTGDAAVQITGFATGVDKIDVSGLTTASIATTIGVNQATAEGAVYFLDGRMPGGADNATVVANAFDSAASGWTDATGTAYFVIADSDSSAIYKFTDTFNSQDGVDPAELTLVGTVNSIISAGDLAFNVALG